MLFLTPLGTDSAFAVFHYIAGFYTGTSSNEVLMIFVDSDGE